MTRFRARSSRVHIYARALHMSLSCRSPQYVLDLIISPSEAVRSLFACLAYCGVAYLPKSVIPVTSRPSPPVIFSLSSCNAPSPSYPEELIKCLQLFSDLPVHHTPQLALALTPLVATGDQSCPLSPACCDQRHQPGLGPSILLASFANSIPAGQLSSPPFRSPPRPCVCPRMMLHVPYLLSSMGLCRAYFFPLPQGGVSN